MGGGEPKIVNTNTELIHSDPLIVKEDCNLIHCTPKISYFVDYNYNYKISLLNDYIRISIIFMMFIYIFILFIIIKKKI